MADVNEETRRQAEDRQAEQRQEDERRQQDRRAEEARAEDQRRHNERQGGGDDDRRQQEQRAEDDRRQQDDRQAEDRQAEDRRQQEDHQPHETEADGRQDSNRQESEAPVPEAWDIDARRPEGDDEEREDTEYLRGETRADALNDLAPHLLEDDVREKTIQRQAFEVDMAEGRLPDMEDRFSQGEPDRAVYEERDQQQPPIDEGAEIGDWKDPRAENDQRGSSLDDLENRLADRDLEPEQVEQQVGRDPASPDGLSLDEYRESLSGMSDDELKNEVVAYHMSSGALEDAGNFREADHAQSRLELAAEAAEARGIDTTNAIGEAWDVRLDAEADIQEQREQAASDREPGGSSLDDLENRLADREPAPPEHEHEHEQAEQPAREPIRSPLCEAMDAARASDSQNKSAAEETIAAFSETTQASQSSQESSEESSRGTGKSPLCDAMDAAPLPPPPQRQEQGQAMSM
ncbi:hypothetical protein HLH33_19155 [Gluconacetobacter diazotrophicus]|uniref:Uncharacterized protein n=1 Tax=Gluconacetobacter diazotrophicus TaxID=33996 RepID=A0A7W4NIJ9_GLUDI|nr:hypothetical protein [Gluconacetobacter diazotrophicus]MBB2158381.1 hypothetical protein [Gluconacetobacter diazotrophicus]